MTESLSKSINIVKAALLVGVVMIHCNPLQYYSPDAGSVLEIYSSLAAVLSFCVPGFFIISGYLFFANIDKFTWTVYGAKMKSRLFSLLIPYLIWCTLYGIVRYFKAKYLGFEGDGIVVDGEFSIIGFIKGYWNTGAGYPMGFALWFIRNLIVFQLLTQILHWIGKYWVLAVPILILPLFDIELYGIEYFLWGSLLAIHKVELGDFIKRYSVLIAILFLALIPVSFYTIPRLLPLLRYISIFVMISVAMECQKDFPRFSGFIQSNSNAFFFIYAIHGMYCTVIDKFYFNVFGCADGWIPASVACFLASLLTNLVLSTAIFLLMRALSPRLLNILCGGRYLS